MCRLLIIRDLVNEEGDASPQILSSSLVSGRDSDPLGRPSFCDGFAFTRGSERSNTIIPSAGQTESLPLN